MWSFGSSSLQQQLRELLLSARVSHPSIILQAPSLKHAHMYCKLQHLPGSETGPLIERYLQHHWQWTRRKKGEGLGDLYCPDTQTNLEVKVSLGGKTHDRFNYVQLRLHHQCEYLLTAYHLSPENLCSLGDLYVYRVAKDDMRELIVRHGMYAHGTRQQLGPITWRDVQDETNTREYALRTRVGDACWRALLPYRINQFQDLSFVHDDRHEDHCALSGAGTRIVAVSRKEESVSDRPWG